MNEGATTIMTDFKPIIDALTAQLSVANIVTIVAGGLAAAVVLYFGWFAIRKLISIVRSAFSKGKIHG